MSEAEKFVADLERTPQFSARGWPRLLALIADWRKRGEALELICDVSKGKPRVIAHAALGKQEGK